jgi:hypothetical protein
VKVCKENKDSKPLCYIPTVVDIARVSRVAADVSARVSARVAARVSPARASPARVSPAHVSPRVSPRVSLARVSPALPILQTCQQSG